MPLPLHGHLISPFSNMLRIMCPIPPPNSSYPREVKFLLPEAGEIISIYTCTEDETVGPKVPCMFIFYLFKYYLLRRKIIHTAVLISNTVL